MACIMFRIERKLESDTGYSWLQEIGCRISFVLSLVLRPCLVAGVLKPFACETCQFVLAGVECQKLVVY